MRRFARPWVGLLAALGAWLNLATASPADGLVAAWDMEAMPVFENWEPDGGRMGGALRFAAGDVVSMGVVPELEGAQAVTLTAWLKRSTSSSRVIAGVDRSPGGGLAVELWDDGAAYFVLFGAAYADGSSPVAGTDWHHLALVFDGANGSNGTRLVGYVDGARRTLDYVGTIPDRVTLGALPFSLGVERTSQTEGLIDDVRVFTGALTASDVASVFAGVEPSVAPLSHWRLDERAGRIAADDRGAYAGELLRALLVDVTSNHNDAVRFLPLVDVTRGLGKAFAIPVDGTSSALAPYHPSLELPDSGGALAAWFRCDLPSLGQDSVWPMVWRNVHGNLANHGGVMLMLYQDYAADPKYLSALIGETPQMFTPKKTSVSSGMWHHAVVTWDSATVWLYLDGVEEGVSARNQPLAWPNETGVLIGHADWTGRAQKFAEGALDDLFLYRRTLSALEVAELYATTRDGGPLDLTTAPDAGTAPFDGGEDSVDDEGPDHGSARRVLRAGCGCRSDPAWGPAGLAPLLAWSCRRRRRA